MSKEEKLLIRESRKFKTAEDFLGMNRITENSKIVWQANKEGQQMLGNKQFIRKPTFADFKKEILPRSINGWYGRGSIRQQYQTMLKREPNIVISFINAEKGWRVTRIADIDYVRAEIQKGMKNGWAMVVDSFETPIAKAVRKIADSEQTLINIWASAAAKQTTKRCPYRYAARVNPNSRITEVARESPRIYSRG